MNKQEILIAILIWMAIFTQSCNPPKHACHQSRYNRHPHDVRSSNTRHDLSRYY